MTWVRRQQAEAKHTCRTPKGEGQPGDLWRCDTCHALWELWRGEFDYSKPERNYWQPATLWQRIRYWGQGHRARVGGYQPTDDLPEPKPQSRNPQPLLDPPRQTGTDWLYSEPENARRS